MVVVEAITVSVAVAVASTVLNLAAQKWLEDRKRDAERARYFREQVHTRYADLGATASEELDRARTVETAMMIGVPDNDFSTMNPIPTSPILTMGVFPVFSSIIRLA